jgi:pyruvate dehydrogenase (quinone)/pyruvate oxidase
MPTEVPVIGDAKESLQALIPLLTRKADRGHLAKYQKAMAGWRSDMEDLENPGRSPIAPAVPGGGD